MHSTNTFHVDKTYYKAVFFTMGNSQNCMISYHYEVLSYERIVHAFFGIIPDLLVFKEKEQVK